MRRRQIALLIAIPFLVMIWVSIQRRAVENGREAYQSHGCGDCHSRGTAPDLTIVRTKYDSDLLVRFIKNPDAVYTQLGRKPLNEGFPPMIRVYLHDNEAEDIAKYLQSLSDQ